MGTLTFFLRNCLTMLSFFLLLILYGTNSLSLMPMEDALIKKKSTYQTRKLAFFAGGKQQFAGLHWNDCREDSYTGKIHVVEASPEPPKEDTTNTIKATGESTEGFDGGELELRLAFIGLGWEFLDETADACKPTTIELPHGFGSIDYPGFQCPYEKNTNTTIPMHIHLSQPIPLDYPISATISIKSEERNFWCLHLDLII